MTPKYTSLNAVQNALRRSETTLRGLVEYYLERIAETRDLNAYVGRHSPKPTRSTRACAKTRRPWVGSGAWSSA
jgi:Asp-tRNA(Asn)/Glu-tRNA(Gln) amidotransferase A subunit family amidase